MMEINRLGIEILFSAIILYIIAIMYFHFKFEGSGNTINELEKNEKMDHQLIRF